MDPDEKELSPHQGASSSPAKESAGEGGILNPNLTEVVTGELLTVVMNQKAFNNIAEKAKSQSPSSLNPNSLEVHVSPTGETLSTEVSEKPSSKQSDQSMKVFLRIRPILISPTKTKVLKPSNDKIAWPKSKGGRAEKVKLEKNKASCIQVCDSHSVTIMPPSTLHRMKSEVYRGFSHVFTADSSQEEVYTKTVSPILEDFLVGKSGLLAALGPSGSGKTHTVFGSAREPGLVPRALRHIFQSSLGSQDRPKRSFYLSMFEIYIDNGKTEKLSDLSPDGGEIQLQQSGLKGLKELLITDHMQAEALIARAMLRRSVAMTNSNCQSSRSQCIISIRCIIDNIDGKVETQGNESVLTIVDLAGAEREKKTGNQGDRLLQSNFINKTSMVFGLCLRSLLEHQKNPKKPLKKHFQSSLLTRYLRDYLEGKKRMALILTVRPTEEDYLDTTFLLRQASPFMEIKFLNKDEINQSKRQHDTMFSVVTERSKRIKTTSPTDKVKITHACEELDEGRPKKASVTPQMVPASKVNGEIACKTDSADSSKERDYKILLGFSKTIWNMLKEHNQKIKVLEKRNLELEKELSEQKICSCACQKKASTEVASLVADTISETISLAEELVGHRSSDAKGKRDVSNEMKKQADVCKTRSDCPEEQASPYLKCEGDVEMESKFHYPEQVKLPNDHLSDFHETKQNEIVGEVEDCHTESEHPQGDSKGEIDVSKEMEKQENLCKTVSDCPEEQRSTNLICMEKVLLECRSNSSEPVLLPEDQLSAFHETKQNEVVGEVKNGRPANMKEFEKIHVHSEVSKIDNNEDSCKTETEQLRDECQGSQNVHSECSSDLKKEDNKETCSDENLKASCEKMLKSSLNQSSTMVSRSVRQSTRKKTEKQKKPINGDHGGNSMSASETRKNLFGHEKSPVKAKPKRRLMPASSSLLRHVNSLDFKDEEALVGGGKGKSSTDDITNANGSTSLLRLLRVNTRR